MAKTHEVPVLLREIAGTNIAIDPVFLGPQYVQRCRDFYPDDAFTLSKRRGTVPFHTIGSTTRIVALCYAQGSIDRFVYAVGHRGPGIPDQLYVSTNDAAFLPVTNGAFTTIAGRYSLVHRGNDVYAGNGIEPLKRIPLGGSAVNLTALAVLADLGSIAVAPDTSSGLLPGTYSYVWALYDFANKRFASRTAVQAVTLTASWSRITFTAPATALTPGNTYHLFVTDADQSIEGAQDQVPGGLVAGATYVLVAVAAGKIPVPIGPTVFHTGKHLAPHRGRIFVAGNPADPRAVFATGILVASVEQQIYDLGNEFPAGARFEIDRPVTGIGPVGQSTAAVSNPQSALAAFSIASTWLLYGDILGDPSASLLQLSGEIGCIAHATIAQTPWGTIFAGPESVYLIRPGQMTEPLDIGWTIAPALRGIPSLMRELACAVYHEGFYKLRIPEPGTITNTAEWWLDCRRPLGAVPPWFGPHTGGPYTCFARTPEHPAENDRAWAAVENTGTVVLLDQPNTFADNGIPIVSRLRYSRVDLGTPFDPKLLKRVRVHAFTSSPTTLSVSVRAVISDSVDDPPTVHPKIASGVIHLKGAAVAQWNVSKFGTAKFGAKTFSRGRLIFPPPEPRGTAFELELSHAEQVALTLRDVELRIAPLEAADRGD